MTGEYGFRHVEFEMLMAHASGNVQETARYVVLEVRRKDRAGGQDLGVLNTEKAIKATVLDSITQREKVQNEEKKSKMEP